MPIYWRYLTKAYIKVFLLSTFGFISVLLITRLKDIARFAALSADSIKVFLYVLYQIPHILPIAIPISCLISSFLLFQRFSLSSELTALRTSGISIKKNILPIVLSSFFISFFNFFITSELTPFCRIHSRKIAHSEVTQNPIKLLERQQLLKIKNAYIDLHTSQDKDLAKDILFIVPNKSNGRLSLISAKEVKLQDDLLLGKNISLLSYFESPQKTGFDSLILENQLSMNTVASNLSKYMKSTSFSLNPIHLPTKMLLIRASMDNNKDPNARYVLSKVEITRRIALSLSAFTLTFIGICFGIEISRIKSKKKLLLAALLSLLILSSFALAKSFKYTPYLAMLIYLLPQPLIIFFSTRALKKISRGYE